MLPPKPKTETVLCDVEFCDETAVVRLAGTMPKDWYAIYIGEENRSARVCSARCLEVLRNRLWELDVPAW
jgi:hypothetical protein